MAFQILHLNPFRQSQLFLTRMAGSSTAPDDQGSYFEVNGYFIPTMIQKMDKK